MSARGACGARSAAETETIMSRPQIRQGDVLLMPVGDPAGEPRRSVDSDGRPLAGLVVHGERTGHAHRLPGRVYDTDDGRRLMMLERPTPMTHEEHDAVEVPAGWWEIRQQREFVPAANRTTRRWD